MANTIQRDSYVHSYEKKLIEANQKYWAGTPAVLDGRQWIYVLHGIPYELEFTVTEDLIAKGLQTRLKLPVISVSCKVKRETTDQLDSSFGFKEKVFLDSDAYISSARKIKADIAARQTAKATYGSKKKLIQIKYKNIECGNSIYDEIIRSNTGRYFDCFDISFEAYYQFIKSAFIVIEKAYQIFGRRKPAYIITTECDYEKGLFASVAVFMGAQLVISSPDYASVDTVLQISPGQALFKDIMLGDLLRRNIEIYLEKNAVKNAVKNTVKETEKETEKENQNYFILKTEEQPQNNILEQIGIKNNKKNVFIMLHALSDEVREAYRHNIYADYNEWYVDTLRIIKQIDDVNWIIKDHPMSRFFHQEDYIRSVFEKNKKEHMYWCDRKISGMQIKEAADCVITCAGDVGIEYWAYGIPTITVSKAYYCNWGISYNLETLKEYENTLKNIKNIPSPKAESIKRAQTCLSAFHEMSKSSDAFASLVMDMRHLILNYLKNGNFEYGYVFHMFCQKYIDLLNTSGLKSSSVFQLNNIREV